MPKNLMRAYIFLVIPIGVIVFLWVVYGRLFIEMARLVSALQ